MPRRWLVANASRKQAENSVGKLRLRPCLCCWHCPVCLELPPLVYRDDRRSSTCVRTRERHHGCARALLHSRLVFIFCRRFLRVPCRKILDELSVPNGNLTEPFRRPLVAVPGRHFDVFRDLIGMRNRDAARIAAAWMRLPLLMAVRLPPDAPLTPTAVSTGSFKRIAGSVHQPQPYRVPAPIAGRRCAPPRLSPRRLCDRRRSR